MKNFIRNASNRHLFYLPIMSWFGSHVIFNDNSPDWLRLMGVIFVMYAFFMLGVIVRSGILKMDEYV